LKDFWNHLKRFTHARIGLQRAGNSLSTSELLSFKLAHSQARDSVWKELDSSLLASQLKMISEAPLVVQSRCRNKQEFLLRPDWGRELSEESLLSVKKVSQSLQPSDCVLVLADGLSAGALQSQSKDFVLAFTEGATRKGFTLGPLVIARYGRVALGDPLGHSLKTRSVLILIGERPGLASPESLSVYFTYAPQESKMDSERNCISNIQEKGLLPRQAAAMALWLMEQSLRAQLSGVRLKVEYSQERLSP